VKQKHTAKVNKVTIQHDHANARRQERRARRSKRMAMTVAKVLEEVEKKMSSGDDSDTSHSSEFTYETAHQVLIVQDPYVLPITRFKSQVLDASGISHHHPSESSENDGQSVFKLKADRA
jgi:hypothetical protein